MKFLMSLFRRMRTRHGENWPSGFLIDPSSRINRDDVFLKSNCQLTIGKNSVIRSGLYFDKSQSEIRIGERCFVASNCFCAEKIIILDDVMISSGGAIFDHDSHSLDFGERETDVVDWVNDCKDWTSVPVSQVVIGPRAWVGYGVIVLKGVTIGEGAVVGAGSVVTKSVPPWTLVAGNPAKKIRELRAYAANQ